MTSINTAATNAIAPIKEEPFNLETAMLTVQLGRIKNLDAQLESQIKGIQAGNAKATKLAEALKTVNSIIDKFGAETDPNKKMNLNAADSQAMTKALDDLGMKPESLLGGAYTENDAYNANRPTFKLFMTTITLPAKPTGVNNTSLSSFKTAAATVKGQLDTNGSTQQTDMLSLQRTMNMRNESFDTASTVFKKTNDANSSILNKV